MEVTLVNPWHEYLQKSKSVYTRIWQPLSLALTAAMLEEEGIDVEIIDANAERLSPQEVARKTQGNKIFITSSSLDRWQCPHTDLSSFLEYVKALKRKGEVYILGSHGTIKPREMFELTSPKGLVIGEPELAILKIVKYGIEKADGVAYKGKGAKKVLIKPKRKYLDLNSVPMPAFQLLPMKKYQYELLGNNFSLFEGSRGCSFNCIFCLKKMYGKNYRIKDVRKLNEEVKHSIENFGTKTAYFIDLEFTLNKRLVEGLCDFLIEQGYSKNFRWCCQTRADLVDKKLLEKMHKAGCRLIHYGVETGSKRVMKLINKNITLSAIEKGVKLTKSAGIESACFFMFGFPTETKSEMQETIDFAKKIEPDYVSFHSAIPYPGTQLGNMMKADKDRSIKSDFIPLNDQSLDKAVRSAYFQFYLRPGYIVSALRQNPRLWFKKLKMFVNYLR